jgi:hypothetical protein
MARETDDGQNLHVERFHCPNHTCLGAGRDPVDKMNQDVIMIEHECKETNITHNPKLLFSRKHCPEKCQWCIMGKILS